MKRTNTKKLYVKAQRMVYTKPICRLYEDFVKTAPEVKCSRSTFFKYKPFYVVVPSEREKESCLCIKCQNIHLQLRGINTFRRQEKLTPVHSVTKYLKLQESLTEDELKSNHPERFSSKSVNYYVFEIKQESYVKEGVTKTYSRTTRVDKNELVSVIYEKLISDGQGYLRHRSHVDNIESILPLFRESFLGTYIERDFSENISIKPKSEVQAAHFSGKQYALHCSIVVRQGERSYVYHLSDDTGHDAFFVDEVLQDIFRRFEIRDMTIIIKSDNAPTQYKNKWAFHLYQDLANEFNVRIIRLYGAAGHGKGLIDAMSNFGVKSILRRNIVTHDVWFANSDEICSYLREQLRSDKIMDYQVVDPVAVDSKRMNKIGLKIKNCMSKHLFDFKPNPKSTSVLTMEYLCDCKDCLELNFEKCAQHEDKTESRPNDDEEAEVECHLDSNNIDENTKVYEFVSVPSYVALASDDVNEPIYIMKVEEKGRTEKEIQDEDGHVISAGDLYLRGKYLKQERSRSRHLKQFSIYPGDGICEPSEVFEVSVELSDDLVMSRESFESLVIRVM